MPSIICGVFVILLITVNETLCNNMTGKYHTMQAREFQAKSGRLLSFNTQDNGDISMELAFNVPFITIPVKRSIDMAQGAIANVNIGAIILGGAITFGFAVVIPGILLLMSKKNFGLPDLGYRSAEPQQQQWWEILNFFDQVLTENDVDTTSCMQRMICWAVQSSAQNVMNGQSSSSDKIIDGLATNKWLQQIMEGTVIHAAVWNGLGSTDCSKEYSQCKISERSIQMLTRQFVQTFDSKLN